TPFSLVITHFHQVDNPDGFPDGDGDYYYDVKINGIEKENHTQDIEDDDFSPNWVITANVDTSQPVQVFISIYDSDDLFRFGDNEMDLNPNSGLLGIGMTVDPLTGKWSGDVNYPSNTSQGGGDDDSDRGRITFEFDSDNDGLYNSWEINQGIDVNNDGLINGS